MLIRYPRRVTVNNNTRIKTLLKVREKICMYTKAMVLLRIIKENYSNDIGP